MLPLDIPAGPSIEAGSVFVIVAVLAVVAVIVVSLVLLFRKK